MGWTSPVTGRPMTRRPREPSGYWLDSTPSDPISRRALTGVSQQAGPGIDASGSAGQEAQLDRAGRVVAVRVNQYHALPCAQCQAATVDGQHQGGGDESR